MVDTGYRNPLRAVRNLVAERIDQGVDYSGTGNVFALGPGVITQSATGNTGWGPPQGIAPGGYIQEELTAGPLKGKLIYVAEGIDPTVRAGQSVTSRTVIGKMVAPIETGFAASKSGTAAAAEGASGSTQYGAQYSQVLSGLGAPAGIPQGKIVPGGGSGGIGFSELKTLWIQAGGPKGVANIAAAIALAESGGRATALNPHDNGGTQSSFGLWQISNGTHTPPASNWQSPQENAKLAVAKYKDAGNSFSPWGTYTSGAYKSFLGGTGSSGSSDTSGGGGGLGWLQATQDIIAGLTGEGTGASAPSDSPLGAISTSIATAASEVSRIGDAVDWFINPTHIVRIVAGIGGGLLVLGGIWQMTHVGGDAPKAAALPLGVLGVGLGSVGLFVAFHNLPSDVTDLPTLLSFVQGDIQSGAANLATPTTGAQS